MLGLASDGEACSGAFALHRDELLELRARATILATGGACALWARTTNPPGATGDGIALAYRAGARVADLEFVQFHPTALAAGSPRDGFLLTEALRGEGATLVAGDGRRIMEGVHPQGDLAPRDVVARAIDAELERGATVYLSIEGLDREPHRDAASPTSSPGCARPASTCSRAACPSRRPPTTRWAASMTDLDGADDDRRPLRLRRGRPHRRARRQPPGLELAAGVLRLRAPRGRSRCVRRARAAPSTWSRRRARAGRRRPSCATGCGATAGWCATPPASRA